MPASEPQVENESLSRYLSPVCHVSAAADADRLMRSNGTSANKAVHPLRAFATASVNVDNGVFHLAGICAETDPQLLIEASESCLCMPLPARHLQPRVMLTSTHVWWKMRGPQETFNKGVIDPQRGFSAEARREKPGCFWKGARPNARNV